MDNSIINRPDCIASGLPDLGVYVACVASYNAGTLHGAWVDLDGVTDADQLQEAIDWVLATSPEPGAEEYAIHDSCGLPSILRSTEWPDLSDLASFAETAETVQDAEAYRLACDYAGQVIDEDKFTATWCGVWDSEADFALERCYENGHITDGNPLASYVDWERVWHGEFECDGWHSDPTECGRVHVWRPV